MSDDANRTPLPARTVKYITNAEELSEAAVEGMVSNPVYVGVPPYRRVVSDEAWIQAATTLIEKKGAEQFLVNMLYMLRVSMVDVVPDEAIPEDYDGPWPDEDEEEDQAESEEHTLSPWRNPLEGHIFCSHDDVPMIVIDDEFVCVAEYLYSHINDSPVTDLITDPVLTLVFRNGHTLPLLCPGCGGSVHVEDHSELLDDINGLTVVNVEWDEEAEELILEFGIPESDESEEKVLEVLAIHLDSVRALTCPHKTAWHDDEEI
jgi:hypothetical protein